jgi:hypothetical protein
MRPSVCSGILVSRPLISVGCLSPLSVALGLLLRRPSTAGIISYVIFAQVLFLSGCGYIYRGHGSVVDGNGAPIPNAVLTFEAYTPSMWMGDGSGGGPDPKRERFTCKTDMNGKFTVATKQGAAKLIRIEGFTRIDDHQWSMVDGLVQDSEKVVVEKNDR